jgi:uncharacterized RDD family membrane protein YckC
MPPPPGGDPAPVPAGLPAPPPMRGGTTIEQELPYATFWQRAGAALIDGLLFVPFLIVPFSHVWREAQDALDNGGNYRVSMSPFDSRFVGWAIAAAAAGAVYHILMIHYRGQTLGKMALAIKVQQIEDGGLPGWDRAATRWAVPVLLGWIPYVGGLAQLMDYLWMLWDPQRQCVHDKAARTIVVRLR